MRAKINVTKQKLKGFPKTVFTQNVTQVGQDIFSLLTFFRRKYFFKAKREKIKAHAIRNQNTKQLIHDLKTCQIHIFRRAS
jgi:hypothetical protein